MKLDRLDWFFMILVFLILAVGVVDIWSASYQINQGSYASYPMKQLFWISFSGAIFVGLLFIPYLQFYQRAYFLYACGIALLVLTIVIGKTVNGSRRWIAVGPFSIQTSEVMKILIVIALARYLKDRPRLDRWQDLLPALGITFLPMIIILKQPDLGTAMLFIPILFAMLLAAGARISHLVLLIVIGINCLPVGYFFLKPYQKARLRTFISLGDLSASQRMGEAYQAYQSQIGVGSGGMLGKGWGKGTQNRLNFVPERHNDFIFSVHCEEFGFLGATILLGLYFLLFLSGLSSASSSREMFGRLVIVGTITMMAMQVCINVGMTIGIFPITGLTLPLVSYGGSSMVTTFIGLSLIMGVKMRKSMIRSVLA